MDGQLISVPLHRHNVSLDYFHLELEAEYALTERWGLVGRVPADIKRQAVSLSEIAPATEAEREAMVRNMNLHHRAETYSGLSDLMLLVANRRYGLFREGDALKVGLGLSLPTGRTEPNPYELGAAGIQHRHIQFGTGTLDPLLELNYWIPLSGSASAGVFSLARLPVAENKKTYQGPREISSGLNVGYRLKGRVSLHWNLTHYYQGYARWDGARDENSGLQAFSAMVGATLRLSEHAAVGADLRYPVWQRTLFPGSDVFEQGPTAMLRVAQTYPPGGQPRRAGPGR